MQVTAVEGAVSVVPLIVHEPEATAYVTAPLPLPPVVESVVVPDVLKLVDAAAATRLACVVRSLVRLYMATRVTLVVGTTVGQAVTLEVPLPVVTCGERCMKPEVCPVAPVRPILKKLPALTLTVPVTKFAVAGVKVALVPL